MVACVVAHWEYADEMYIDKTTISGEMLSIGQVVQGAVEIDLKNGIVYIIGSFLCGCNSNLASVHRTISKPTLNNFIIIILLLHL